EVDSEKFARRVLKEFLEEQSDIWMIEFYDLLNDHPALWRARTASHAQGILRNKPFVRLENEGDRQRHVTPYGDNGLPNAFLPTGSEAGDDTVKRTISQNEDAYRFLNNLGLRKHDVVDQVLRIVLQRYRAGTPSLSDADYAADITAIADAIEECRQEER